MNWKCDICDTYNDERESACYVCGQVRSAASIREGKIRAKKERALRINNAVYKNGYNISKVMFIAGLLSSMVVIVVATIIKIMQGNIGSFVTNLSGIMEHIGDKILMTVPFNMEIIFCSMIKASIFDIGSNFEYIISIFGATLSVIPISIQEIFVNTAKKNFENGYIGSAEYLKSLSDENLLIMGNAIEQLQCNVIRRISDGVDIIKSVFQNIKQYF